jgi:hypothetical protein
MRTRWFLESVGMSLLYLIPYFYPLLVPSRIFYLHHRLPITHLAGGLLLDFCGFLVVSSLVFESVTRMPLKVRRFCIALLTAISLTCFGNRAIWAAQIAATHLQISTIYVDSRFYVLASTSSAVAAVVASFTVPNLMNCLTRITRLILAGFAFSILWVLPSLCVPLLLKSETRPIEGEAVSSMNRGVPKDRIIWILFDELSYELVFDHPYAPQGFANFRALKNTSTYFSSLGPIGTHTDKIIASLLSGHVVEGMKSNSNGDLLEWNRNMHRWLEYDPNATLFGVAHAAGWTIGIAGWYNPYCRIFSNIADKCSWIPGIQSELPFEQMGASEDESAVANSLVIPFSILAGLTPENRPRSSALQVNIADYRSIMSEARNLIHDNHLNFVFIHLPVPHPPGIYDRRLKRLCLCGNYFDNLALADEAVGSLMEEVTHTAGLNRTTVIISSDHSWRPYQWRNSPGWSPEEERVARSDSDQRPVLLIHFPQQTSARDINARISEIAENGVVASMLRGQISNPEELARLWSSPTSSH